MKKIALSALVVASLISAPSFAGGPAATKPATAKAAATSYKLQPQLSTLGWEGKAVTHGHNGTVQFSTGELMVNGSELVGGTVTVDMKSIKATDIKDADTQAKFYGHMAADDFFLVEQFPTATFKITKVTPIKGAAADANNATITGDMTIKGKTNTVTFPAKVGVKNGVAAASGTVNIDRTKYGLTYGSKSFFSSIGDKAINDDFSLSFNVIAKK